MLGSSRAEATACSGSICLGSVSPSPYKVAQHKSHSEQGRSARCPTPRLALDVPIRFARVPAPAPDQGKRAKVKGKNERDQGQAPPHSRRGWELIANG
jgi:hypothetical protein